MISHVKGEAAPTLTRETACDRAGSLHLEIKSSIVWVCGCGCGSVRKREKTNVNVSAKGHAYFKILVDIQIFLLSFITLFTISVKILLKDCTFVNLIRFNISSPDNSPTRLYLSLSHIHLLSWSPLVKSSTPMYISWECRLA